MIKIRERGQLKRFEIYSSPHNFGITLIIRVSKFVTLFSNTRRNKFHPLLFHYSPSNYRYSALNQRRFPCFHVNLRIITGTSPFIMNATNHSIKAHRSKRVKHGPLFMKTAINLQCGGEPSTAYEETISFHDRVSKAIFGHHLPPYRVIR